MCPASASFLILSFILFIILKVISQVSITKIIKNNIIAIFKFIKLAQNFIQSMFLVRYKEHTVQVCFFWSLVPIKNLSHKFKYLSISIDLRAYIKQINSGLIPIILMTTK